MSSWRGHMLIGATGGLALVRVLRVTGHFPVLPDIPPLGVETAIIGGSAFLALLPDIDEPNSWIGQRVQLMMTLAGIILALVLAVGLELPLQWIAVYAAVGMVVGKLAGWLLLKAIRTAAGGHRRLTHSLPLTGVLLLGTVALWSLGYGAWSLIPLAVAWGQVLHVLGDLPTPAGVPLFYPFSKQDFGLPQPLSSFGEGLAAISAIAVASILIWTWV